MPISNQEVEAGDKIDGYKMRRVSLALEWQCVHGDGLMTVELRCGAGGGMADVGCRSMARGAVLCCVGGTGRC